MLSDDCIYTIRHSDDLFDSLEKGGTGKFTERKRWVTGKRLLHEAKQQEKRLAIVFAPAEATNPLFGWGLLDAIILKDGTTVYSFSGLRRFEGRRPSKSSLKKRRGGEALSNAFIRPYAICKIPAYLRGV